MAFQLTEQQHAAVFDRGGGMLVSAAAGSGKTRVLVERLIFLEQDEIEKNKGIRIEKYLSVLTE